MAKIVFYDATERDEKDFAQLKADNQMVFVNESLDSSNIVADADIISVFVSSVVDGTALKHFNNLKLISCRSAGYNNIDLTAAKNQKVLITTTPTYSEHTVAEYAFTLLLALTRKLLPSVAEIQAGSLVSESVQGTDLFGKTIGIVGVGRIGQNVAKYASAFGMNVIGFDPFLKPEIASDLSLNPVDFDRLLHESDIITLHTPLTDKNKHMFNAEAFAKMRPGSYFINTARGELMVTKDLIEAVLSGQIAGAGIDVLEGEKLVEIHEEEILLKKGRVTKELLNQIMANNVLLKIPNIIFTGHNAYNTDEAVRRINSTTLTNIKSFLTGEPTNLVKNN